MLCHAHHFTCQNEISSRERHLTIFIFVHLKTRTFPPPVITIVYIHYANASCASPQDWQTRTAKITMGAQKSNTLEIEPIKAISRVSLRPSRKNCLFSSSISRVMEWPQKPKWQTSTRLLAHLPAIFACLFFSSCEVDQNAYCTELRASSLIPFTRYSSVQMAQKHTSILCTNICPLNKNKIKPSITLQAPTFTFIHSFINLI